MAFSPMSQGGKGPTTLSEINVTPLVDVMLVLLIIFMITSSMETVQAEQERANQEERQARIEDLLVKQEMAMQQVPISLPKTTAQKVNETEQKKLTLSFNSNYEFFLGTTPIVRCLEVAPNLAAELKARKAAGDKADGAVPQGFKDCLTTLEDKLLENEKLKQDGELYLRADHTLDYGMVLTVMARVRKAGITKFGLVAEPDLEQ